MTVRGRGYSAGEDTYGYPGEVMADKPTFWDVFTQIPGEVIKTISQPIEFGLETTEAIIGGLAESASDLGGVIGGGNGNGGDTPKPKLLDTATGKTGLLLLTLAGLPVAYSIYRAQMTPKKARTPFEEDAHLVTLEGASNRAVSLAASLMPALGLPIAYIAVEDLERTGYIAGELGDRVQALITAGVVAPAVGGVIGSVLGAVVGKGKAAKAI